MSFTIPPFKNQVPREQCQSVPTRVEEQVCSNIPRQQCQQVCLLDTGFEFHARFVMWRNVFYLNLPGCKGSSTTTVYHCPPSAVSDDTPAAMFDCSKTAVSDGTPAVLQLHSTPTRTAGVQFHPEATMQHSSKVHESPGKILYALATKANGY